jgi:uncharacterized membrane protein YgdD (TMEM256/DUF423 family)
MAPWPLLFFVASGSLLCGLAVLFGAFGAHVFGQMFTEQEVWTFRTGVEYQLLHGIGMVLTGLLGRRLHHVSACIWAGWAFLVGIFLFCFSLYGLVLTKAAYLGTIAPAGGLAFIFGWMTLAWSAYRGWREER